MFSGVFRKDTSDAPAHLEIFRGKTALSKNLQCREKLGLGGAPVDVHPTRALLARALLVSRAKVFTRAHRTYKIQPDKR